MYAGLTISDKPALLEAKERGKTTLTMAFSDRVQVVNIDLALAQIEEMESAEKPKNDGCEFCKHFGKPSAVVWDSHVLKMSGKDVPYKPFIKIELHTRKNEAALIATSQGDDNKQNKTTVSIHFCPMCGRSLASPYTEGETK